MSSDPMEIGSVVLQPESEASTALATALLGDPLPVAAMAPMAAAIQMNSAPSVEKNLATALRLLTEAVACGAVVAVLPENFAYMGARDRDKLAVKEEAGSGPIQDFLAEHSAALNLWIIAGTVPIAVAGDPGRVAPACLVYDSNGALAARYNKIHLFDVDVPGGERYRESATIAAGADSQAVVVDTPVGRVGLSVCYDVRFPELYRRLSQAGAEVLVVPAAFTVNTGKAHWETLLRARAIENLSYVLAPGQCGTHASGRATYGHSLIADPWGEVIASKDDGEGVVLAAISLEKLRAVRAGFPALTHRRL